MALAAGPGNSFLKARDPFGEARSGSVALVHAADDTLYGIHGLNREDTANNGDLRQQIAVRSNDGATTLTIAPATGNYASPLRAYFLRIHTVARQVSIDSRPLPRGAGQTLTDSSGASSAGGTGRDERWLWPSRYITCERRKESGDNR